MNVFALKFAPTWIRSARWTYVLFTESHKECTKERIQFGWRYHNHSKATKQAQVHIGVIRTRKSPLFVFTLYFTLPLFFFLLHPPLPPHVTWVRVAWLLVTYKQKWGSSDSQEFPSVLNLTLQRNTRSFLSLSFVAGGRQSLITGTLVKTGSNKWLACHGWVADSDTTH